MSQPKIVQLDPQTKAVQLRSGPDHSEIHLGSTADARLFLRYNGSTYVGYSYWNPDVYWLNGVLLSERASGIPLHTTLELLCSGRLDLDVREAFFDEFVADDRQAALPVWVRWGELYHVKRLKFRRLFFCSCLACEQKLLCKLFVRRMGHHRKSNAKKNVHTHSDLYLYKHSPMVRHIVLCMSQNYTAQVRRLIATYQDLKNGTFQAVYNADLIIDISNSPLQNQLIRQRMM